MYQNNNLVTILDEKFILNKNEKEKYSKILHIIQKSLLDFYEVSIKFRNISKTYFIKGDKKKNYIVFKNSQFKKNKYEKTISLSEFIFDTNLKNEYKLFQSDNNISKKDNKDFDIFLSILNQEILQNIDMDCHNSAKFLIAINSTIKRIQEDREQVDFIVNYVHMNKILHKALYKHFDFEKREFNSLNMKDLGFDFSSYESFLFDLSFREGIEWDNTQHIFELLEEEGLQEFYNVAYIDFLINKTRGFIRSCFKEPYSVFLLKNLRHFDSEKSCFLMKQFNTVNQISVYHKDLDFRFLFREGFFKKKLLYKSLQDKSDINIIHFNHFKNKFVEDFNNIKIKYYKKNTWFHNMYIALINSEDLNTKILFPNILRFLDRNEVQDSKYLLPLSIKEHDIFIKYFFSNPNLYIYQHYFVLIFIKNLNQDILDFILGISSGKNYLSYFPNNLEYIYCGFKYNLIDLDYLNTFIRTNFDSFLSLNFIALKKVHYPIVVKELSNKNSSKMLISENKHVSKCIYEDFYSFFWSEFNFHNKLFKKVSNNKFMPVPKNEENFNHTKMGIILQFIVFKKIYKKLKFSDKNLFLASLKLGEFDFSKYKSKQVIDMVLSISFILFDFFENQDYLKFSKTIHDFDVFKRFVKDLFLNKIKESIIIKFVALIKKECSPKLFESINLSFNKKTIISFNFYEKEILKAKNINHFFQIINREKKLLFLEKSKNLGINEKDYILISNMEAENEVFDLKNICDKTIEKNIIKSIDLKGLSIEIRGDNDVIGHIGSNVPGVCISTISKERKTHINKGFLNLIVRDENKIYLWGLLMLVKHSYDKESYFKNNNDCFLLNNLQGSLNSTYRDFKSQVKDNIQIILKELNLPVFSVNRGFNATTFDEELQIVDKPIFLIQEKTRCDFYGDIEIDNGNRFKVIKYSNELIRF